MLSVMPVIYISETIKGKGCEMDNSKLKTFIATSLERWQQIKKDLSNNREMTAYLKKSYPVVIFDHHQLALDFVKNLYDKTDYIDKKNPKPEEIKKEEFRLRMVAYFEKGTVGGALKAPNMAAVAPSKMGFGRTTPLTTLLKKDETRFTSEKTRFFS